MTLECDVHEPELAMRLLAPSVPVSREILNERGWADYRWQNHEGKWVQVERKTWSEVLASIDAVEDQLRRHLANQPEARLLFLLEGVVTVTFEGTYVMKYVKEGSLLAKNWKSGTRLGRVYSWLYSISGFVEVFQTFDYAMSCQFLAQAYMNDQKAIHQTFNRHFKKVMFHPNPQVVSLMGLAPNLGEKRAEALIDRFTTVYNVMIASPADLMDVNGIGKGLAHSILARVGRTDV